MNIQFETKAKTNFLRLPYTIKLLATLSTSSLAKQNSGNSLGQVFALYITSVGASATCLFTFGTLPATRMNNKLTNYFRFYFEIKALDFRLIYNYYISRVYRYVQPTTGSA